LNHYGHRMPSNRSSKATAAATTTHSWFSNPLDWPPIDRLLLLSAMVMLVPVFFGVSLAITMVVAPTWLNAEYAVALLVLNGAYAAGLFAFQLMALRRRRHTITWPAFESFIIHSHIIVTLIQSWLSGTHLTGGMLLLLIGAYMSSALADIRKVRVGYGVVVVIFIVLAIVEFSGSFKYAPLFAKPPYNADGSPVFGWLVVQVIQITAMLLITYLGIMTSTRWVERENLFREMSTIDGLTRLTNRRSFIERSQSEFARAQRVPVTGISCIMIDIDHFKKINDTLGHHAGDVVLVKTSALLLASARPYDEVGRYGGEEFAILLPATTLEVATQVAERLREEIARQKLTVDGKVVRVTASFGVACFPGANIQNINDLLKAADKALYAAKYGGRNRVVAEGKRSIKGLNRLKAPAKKKTPAKPQAKVKRR
jgi:diguanylate cyclase